MSTDISIDDRVTDLADPSMDGQEFDALLYTWMIPHADDARRITANPRQLLMLVIPGFRWRGVVDVQRAIERMVERGLLSYTPERDYLRFPEHAFYRWQSYIPPDRRTADDSPQDDDSPNGAVTTPQNAAKHRNAAVPPQNASSVSGSFSVSGSVSSSVSEDDVSPGDDSDEPDDVDQVYAHFKARVQPRSRLCPRKKIQARLKKFSVDELIQGIDHFAEDWWWMENNAARGAEWFFESDKRSEQFLLIDPRRQRPERNGNVVPHPAMGNNSRYKGTEDERAELRRGGTAWTADGGVAQL